MTKRDPKLLAAQRMASYVALVMICAGLALMSFFIGLLIGQPLLSYGGPVAAAAVCIAIIVRKRRPGYDGLFLGEGDERTQSMQIYVWAVTGGVLEVAIFIGYSWASFARSELALAFVALLVLAALSQIATVLYLRLRR